ncbi:TPA: YraN family protein [Patescibacteria group bacterium]|uniref:UPF0102 protein UV59_C0039G0006 n=1 Tax=Candidatus Gottesmanbacteria bacterium GW2011_GWA1_43_11 TaxID=1618436 RepID=A0A0G1F9A2_9BACT|nr:MAG: hypothetical protein UV59_C0039G0006 [Candidatus Gottesmanbacteria bacterium GW2011_GWA1_43_11]HCS79023.1 YraN family protein [Patescibacteria group bacterium]
MLSGQNQHKGKLGENAAATFLAKKGYRIISRNFFVRGGELDLVAVHDNTLIFVEVKTRSGADFGTAEEAVTPWKIKALLRAGQYFKLKHPNLPEALRLDLVTVSLNSANQVTHLEHLGNIAEA